VNQIGARAERCRTTNARRRTSTRGDPECESQKRRVFRSPAACSQLAQVLLPIRYSIQWRVGRHSCRGKVLLPIHPHFPAAPPMRVRL